MAKSATKSNLPLRYAAVSGCLILSLLASGCWSRTEIQDRFLVTAVAFDKGQQMPYKVSVALLRPTAAGKSATGEGGGQEKATDVKEAEGMTPSDAVNRISLKTGRKLFWGHMRLIVFSEETAKVGVRDLVDFLMRNRETRMGSFVTVVQGSAQEALDMELGVEKIFAYGVAKMIEGGRQNGMTTRIKLWDFTRYMTNQVASPVAPLMDREVKKDKIMPVMRGTAVFREDRLIGTLNEDETQGYLLLINQMRKSLMEVNGPKGQGKVGLALEEIQRKLKIEEGLEPRFSIQIMVNARVGDSTSQENLSLKENQEYLEKALEEVVLRKCQATLKRAKEDLKWDVFSFGDEIWRHNPQDWKELEPRWEEQFLRTEVAVEVKARIVNLGEMSTKQLFDN